MDRTDEGTVTPPHTPPSTVSVQPLQITPDNVVELAVLFQNATDSLQYELRSLEADLRLPEPWMNDGASEWMREFFHSYFLNGENSFLGVLQSIHSQHQAHAEALKEATAQYGKTDELNAALARQLEAQPPR